MRKFPENKKSRKRSKCHKAEFELAFDLEPICRMCKKKCEIIEVETKQDNKDET